MPTINALGSQVKVSPLNITDPPLFHGVLLRDSLALAAGVTHTFPNIAYLVIEIIIHSPTAGGTWGGAAVGMMMPRASGECTTRP